VRGAAKIRFEAKTLREMLAATSFSISHDETRYALNGETHGSWPGGADWAETSASSRRSPFRSSNRHSVGTPPKQSNRRTPLRRREWPCYRAGSV